MAALACAATALAAHPTARPLTTPDPGFNGDGFAPTSLGADGAEAFAVQRYPDGRVAVAGTWREPMGDRVFIAVHTSTGAPDPSFGDGGVRLTTLDSEGPATNETLALQPDGKLVVAARVVRNGGKSALAIARFDDEGEPDPFFGTSGVAYLQISGVQVHDLALDSQGRIVVAGSSDNRLLIARFHASDGSPDQTFGDVVDGKTRAGFTLTDVGAPQDEEALALTIQPDDKPVIAGEDGPPGSSDLLIARYTIEGDLDTTFSSPDGIHREDLPGNGAAAHAVDRHPDGRLTIAGEVFSPDTGHRRVVVHRFTSAGGEDLGPTAKTFGGDNDAGARAVEALDGGGAVIAGRARDVADARTKVLLARLRADHTTEASSLTKPTEATDARAEDLLLFNRDHAAAVAGAAIVSTVSNALAARYGEPVPDTDPPETTIGGAPLSGLSNVNPGFTFSADEPASTFECRLDGAAFAACTSPHSYSNLPPGDHTFEVRAIDDAGNVDPTPATHTWNLPNPPPGARPVQFPGSTNVGNVPGLLGAPQNFPPRAEFRMEYAGQAEGRPLRPGPRHTVWVEPTGSSDLDGEIVAYRWLTDAVEATGGALERATAEGVSLSFATEGRRNIVLEVVDDEGATGRMSLPIEVRRNAPPVVRSIRRHGNLNEHDGKLIASFSDDTGVRSLQWHIDGELVGVTREGYDFLRYRDSSRRITNQEHLVEVIATDHENATTTFSRRIDFPPSPVCRRVTMAQPRYTALKVTGCDRSVDGNVSHGRVEVNGIVVAPRQGRPVTVTRGAVTRIEASSAEVFVRGVEVFDGNVDWEVRRTPNVVAPRTSTLEGFEVGNNAELEGLAILGIENDLVTLRRNAGATMRLNLDLPAGFDNSGGAATRLEATPSGAARARAAQAGADEICFDAPQTTIATITVDRLHVCTNLGTGDWRGDARVSLPTPSPVRNIDLAVVFVNGGIDSLTGGADTNVNLGPTPLELRRIDFGIDTTPPTITGGVRVVLPVLSVDALTGNVRLTLAFPYRGNPFDFRARGDAQIFGFPFATADVHVRGLDLFEAEGRFGLRRDDARVEAYAFGTVMGDGRFDFGGGGSACVDVGGWQCLGVDALISSVAAAACLHIGRWRPGMAYYWSSGLEVLYGACDIGDYRATMRATQAASSGLDVPAGLPGVVFAVEGRDGAPRIRLNGPNGEFIEVPETMDATRNDRFVLIPMQRTKTTHVALESPPPGRWTVEELPGSTPVTRVRVAHGLRRPTVDARVRGRGHRREIVYTASQEPGQEIAFVERFEESWNSLGTVKDAKGRLRFRPGDGPAGNREIFAVVRRNGVTRDRIRVASYRAPKPLLPGRVRKLRARRRGASVRVTWRPARRASRYRVEARLSDGRRRLWLVSRKRRSLVVRGVARRVGGTVRVAALRRDNRPGRAATARIRRR